MARGNLRIDKARYTGKDGNKDVDDFPFPITRADVLRGQERFNIYCSPCHSRLGDGNGMIVRRGFRKAGDYHTEKLLKAPVGHFFDVITNGFGAMPSYASRVEPDDRWRIAAYIRVLQLSENATHRRRARERARKTGGAARMDGPAMTEPSIVLPIGGAIRCSREAPALLLCVAGYVLDRDQFLRSYLFADIYWTGMALGCLGILLLHHTVGGKWGMVIRRLCEAGARTIPYMAIFLVPVLLAMHDPLCVDAAGSGARRQ